MARFIHITDTHEDTANKILAVGKFAKKNSIDAILHTGDLISAEKTAQTAIQALQRLPKPDESLIKKIQENKATEEEKQKAQQIMMVQQQTLIAPFAKEYQTIDGVLANLKNTGIDIAVTLGNHDLTIAYELMRNARFADLEDIVIKGINIKGLQNTWEFPTAYGPLQQLIMPYLVNYALGMDAGNDKELNQIHDEELKRLNQGNRPDLILMHKELKDKAEGDKRLGTAAKKYLSENKYIPVLCGHYHEELSIENYKDHPFIKANPDMFYVIDVDEKTKKINYIDIYKLVKKGTKQNTKTVKKKKPEMVHA